jgi:sec-independent protein translocase protein TatA
MGESLGGTHMSVLPLGFLQNIGLPELIIILVIVLLIFGSRLPSLGRSLGRSLFEFKSGLKEGEQDAAKKDEKPAQTAQTTDSKEQKAG